MEYQILSLELLIYLTYFACIMLKVEYYHQLLQADSWFNYLNSKPKLLLNND